MNTLQQEVRALAQSVNNIDQRQFIQDCKAVAKAYNTPYMTVLSAVAKAK